MKTLQTIAGNNYVVYSKNGGTVTDASGTLNKTVEAGDFLFVPAAPSDMLMCDDDESVIKQVNFKNAAAVLRLLGGGLPSWAKTLKGELVSLLGGAKVELHFSKKKQHLLILTDLADDSMNEAVGGVVALYAPSGVTFEVFNINKYAACTTESEIETVNADYKKDLTKDKEWVYSLPELTVFSSPNMSRGFFYGSDIKKIKGVFPKCTSSTALLGEMKKIEEVDVEFPIATYVTNTCLWSTTLKKVRIVAPKVRFFYGNANVGSTKFVDCELHAPVAENIQDLCRGARYLEEVKGKFGANVAVGSRAFYDCEKLRVLPTNYPKMQVAENMFYGCQLSAETAIAILDSFPKLTSGSHLVTVGIHVDYQNDESVAEAVANAEAKGWTVTLQWNGTATAQASATYGLRRQPIYAKRGTMELPDGTTELYLDWGHYVTNWEQNGYMEFASLEEAEELLTEA